MKNSKLFQSVIAIIMLAFMLVPSITPVFADSVEGTWFPKKSAIYGSMYTPCEKKTKETSEQVVGFECGKVYPCSGLIDTYSKMKVQVANSACTRGISELYTIRENTGVLWLELDEYRSAGEVIRLRLRGNDPKKDAYVDYAYNPM